MKKYISTMFLIFVSGFLFGQQNSDVEFYLNKILKEEIKSGWGIHKNAIIVIKGVKAGDADKLKEACNLLELSDIKKIWSVDGGNAGIRFGKKGKEGVIHVICTKEGKKKLRKL